MQACIARYGGVVWSLARRLSTETSEAEDAVQEIFLDLWKSADRFDGSVSSELTFVAMIARRRLLDRRRAHKRRPETEPVEDHELFVPAPQADTVAEVAMASRALGELSTEQREVLVLSAVHGFSHEEIAKTKGMPLGTVKSHARRALTRIRALLTGQPEEGST
jgi:RNA polymerase sigma-70 factor (ECF subfamily)